LGDHHPDREAARLCGCEVEHGLCDRPAIIHIIWTPDVENSPACAEHAAEVRREYAFVGFHRYEHPCSMTRTGRSQWLSGDDRCVLVDEDDPPALTMAQVLVEVPYTWPGDADRPRPHAPGAPCPCGCECRDWCDDERMAAARRALPDGGTP
jgi:hypothetical protein